MRKRHATRRRGDAMSAKEDRNDIRRDAKGDNKKQLIQRQDADIVGDDLH